MSKFIESRPEPESAPLVRFPAERGSWERPESDAVGREFTLDYYLFLVKRQRWRILTFVVVFTALVTMVALALPKKYRASVLLRVDPLSAPVVGQASQANLGQLNSTMLVTTESKIVTSPAVVLEAVRNLNLGQAKEFAPKPGASTAEPARTDRLLAAVSKDISVSQPLGTVLLNIGFTTHDPQLSADGANGVANAFLDQSFKTRAKALEDSSRYMSQQLDAMRAQMERDQMALVNYESTHDLVDPDAKTNIYQARLAQINTDFTKVQAQRMALEADDEIVQSGDLDALLTSRRGAALIPLQERLLADQRQLSKMAATYGPREPLYRQEAQIVQHDQEVLRRQQLHIAAQVQDQYRAAVAEEQLLFGALNREKAAMNAFNLRAIKYRALKAAADGSQNLYYGLEQRIQDADVAAGLRSEDLRIISPARVPDKPVSPRPLLDGVLAFILSALLGIGAAIAMGLMDKTLASPDQVEMRLGLPAIASLPLVSLKQHPDALKVSQYAVKLLPETGSEPGGSGAEALRQRSAFREAILSLHTAVQFSGAERLTVLAITSSLPGEGKSTAAAHLAGAFAALGTRTILVDADLRKPNVHRIFGVPSRCGLSTVLRGQCGLEEALAPAFANLTVLPSGPIASAPSELLHLGLPEVVDELRARFEMVLIDCPPVLGFSDTSSIAHLAEGVLVVVKAGATEQQKVAAALRQLKAAHANLLGIVLNRVSEQTDAYYSYQSKYYGGYAGEDDDD
ncbi:MAG: GumC family protein [Terriglobales bacterium]